jgi:acetylornithine deacetylase/succinyl-diaminopimelate desuccinylase-like protein
VEFLKKLASELKLDFKVFHPEKKDNKPTVILTLHGSDSKLPAIMVNSHMDVVPVFEEFWTHKPFSADIDEEGRIFARGSQDMKCEFIAPSYELHLILLNTFRCWDAISWCNPKYHEEQNST